jgi:gas vesicle protein
MATQIGEDTQVQLDLKTIGMIVGGVIALASMWFTLQGDIKELQNQIAPEEFVKKMEFNLKDELIRATIIQIDKSTTDLKEDIEDNKAAIKENTDKLYEITRKR